jgi:hypothetical protein
VTDSARTLREIDEAVAELRAVRDRLATVLYGLEIESHWLVPQWARPHCSLNAVKMCTSWTCLLDQCGRAYESWEIVTDA